MDRRNFFKKLFKSTATVAVAPLVLPAKLPSKPKIEAITLDQPVPIGTEINSRSVYADNCDFSIHIDGTEVSHLCKRFEITNGFDYPYKLKIDFVGKLPYAMIVDSLDKCHRVEITSRGVKYFDCKVELKDWIVGWDGKHNEPLVTHAEFYVQQHPMQTIQSEIYGMNDFDDKLQIALERLNRRGYSLK